LVFSQIANAQDRQFRKQSEMGDLQPEQVFDSSKGAADMVPVAYIEHQLPGRARLRVPSRRGDVPLFEKVVRDLSKHPAIRELSATPLTGSITLQHFGPLQPIIAAAADQKLFATRRLEPQGNVCEPIPASGLPEGPRFAGGIATGLSGLSLFQATQGNVLGSAAENLWHAFGAQRFLGRPDIAAVFVALGIYQILRGPFFGSASSLFFYALVVRQMAAMEQARARRPAVAAARTVSSASGEALTGSSGADAQSQAAVEKRTSHRVRPLAGPMVSSA
jgi:hypothetical protein